MPAPSSESTNPDPLREWTAQHLPALAELVEIGMDLARMIREQASQAVQSETPADIGDLGGKFARVARAVRQTVALGSKLADDLDGLNDRAAARRTAERRTQAIRVLRERQALGAERKAEAADHLERTVDRETPESDREDLLSDLLEWRSETGEDEAFAEASVAEIVNQICRDLGVAPDWSRLTPEALTRIVNRPSRQGAAFAVWPPSGSNRQSPTSNGREPHPSPDTTQAQPPDQPQAP
jgi:hypothetical protein